MKPLTLNQDVSSANLIDRNYRLFVVLAGVPNWYLNWTNISPIAKPRGLPSDFALENANPRILRWLPWSFSRDYVHRMTTDDKRIIWMGDHSHSWLTGDEILAWAKKTANFNFVETGIVTRAVYESWDGKSFPGYCSRGSVDSNAVLVEDNSVKMKKSPHWTHIKCQWTSNLSEGLRGFFDEVETLISEHGFVRFVFGFD